MKTLITRAIEDRCLIRLTYNGLTRTVEPHVLGLTEDQREALLCWQVSPPMTQGGYWLLCYLDSIFNLRTLEARIERKPEGPFPPLNGFVATYAVLERP